MIEKKVNTVKDFFIEKNMIYSSLVWNYTKDNSIFFKICTDTANIYLEIFLNDDGTKTEDICINIHKKDGVVLTYSGMVDLIQVLNKI